MSLWVFFSLLGCVISQCIIESPQSIPDTCTPISNDFSFYSGSENINSGSNSASVLSESSVPSGYAMIIQMQGVSIDSSNTEDYGGSDGSGKGFIYNESDSIGKYEFNVISSTTSIPGGYNIIFENNFENDYFTGDVFRFQVITFPFCEHVILDSSISIPPWNGEIGGVIPILANTLQINSDLDLVFDGFGFRGGFAPGSSSSENSNDYVNDCTGGQRDGEKGEGIAGQPSFDGSETPSYPDGSCSRGSPGNAGGGGNRGTSGTGGGGGGGSNGGFGQDGFPSSNNNALGGLGGVSLYPDGIENYDRIYLGGGGGSGRFNAQADGGNGGAIVIIHANEITDTEISTSLRISSNGLKNTSPNKNGGGKKHWFSSNYD